MHGVLIRIARAVGDHPYAVGVAGTVGAVAIVALSLVPTFGSRADALARVTETSQNLSSIIALDLERNGQFHDAQLEGMVHSAEDPRTWALPADLRNRQLFGNVPDNSYVDGEFVVDATGRIVASTDGDEVGSAVRLSDRDYFLVHQRNPSVGLYVSHPFRSRVRDGKLSIALARRIDKPDGAFAGVAFLEVRLELFQRLFDRIDTSDTGAVAIVLDDGTVLARKPYADEDVGTSIARLPVYGQMASHASGSATSRDVRGVLRRYAYTHVPHLPVIAIVAPALDTALAPWRRQALITAVVAVAFGIVLAAGAWLLAYTLRDKLRAQDELARLATTDALTKLSNRRILDQRLDEEWHRAHRDVSMLSLLFVDIDRFKLFNDTYGHAAGDETLAAVAQCIASAARRSGDVAARYGGEEFTVILPGTGSDGARRIAETIRQNVQHLGIANEGSEMGCVTVSIGCATCRPASGGDPASLLALADEQLYAAKSSGRNQVRSITVDGMPGKRETPSELPAETHPGAP